MTGLVIAPTFDTSITNDPNAATIMNTINAAIAMYQARFTDPVTVSYQSTNSGGSWAAANAGLPVDDYNYALAINPTTPSALYAGTGGGLSEHRQRWQLDRGQHRLDRPLRHRAGDRPEHAEHAASVRLLAEACPHRALQGVAATVTDGQGDKHFA